MRGHQGIKEAIQSADSISVSPIVLGELQAGFHHGRHSDKNRKTLKQFLASPPVHVVAMDEETAERYAVILNALWAVGRPLPTNGLFLTIAYFVVYVGLLLSVAAATFARREMR